MEVSPGYKQTEVGVIPGDWNAERLGGLVAFVTSGSRGWAQFYSETGALFIRSQNVRDGRLSFEDVQYVSPPSGAEGDRTKVVLNDLLITITGNSVGNVALVDQAFEEAYISQHVGLVRLREPRTAAYICRYLSPNAPGNPQIVGSQSGQSKPGLNLQDLRNFWIALPPSAKELHAIAEALRDVDALLGGLDRLIAKKRDLKQAAMQQLLTGRTRLPGFHGQWEVTCLDAVITRAAGFWGVDGPDDLHTMEVKVIRAGDIDSDGRLRSVASRYFTESEYEKAHCSRGDMVFTTSGSVGKVWLCDGRANVAASNFVRVLRPDADRATGVFLAQLLRSQATQLLMSEHVATGVLANLSRSFFSSTWLNLPDLAEQEAIAAVLHDMDAELTTLQARHDKTRDLKQAMMQELLTGKTRLVPEGAAHA